MPNPSVKSEQGSDFAPYLGHWIQSEKLSKIKLPLIYPTHLEISSSIPFLNFSFLYLVISIHMKGRVMLSDQNESITLLIKAT